MSLAKDDEPTDEKNELCPLNRNIPELKPAFAIFNYGQEKYFDGMDFMESHASFFHTISSIIRDIQSYKRSPKYDQIQKPSQICQGVPQDDNVIEEDQISTKSTQEDPALTEDMQEDTLADPVLPKNRQVVPDWVENEKVVPILAKDGQMDSVSAEDGQEVPVIAEDKEEHPVFTEGEGPVLAEEGQEAPELSKEDPVLAEDMEEDTLVDPVLPEDRQVVPDWVENGKVVPILAKDGQMCSVSAKDGEGGPVIAEDKEEHPVFTEGEGPVLAEEGQEAPVLAKEDPVLAEEAQENKDSKQPLVSKCKSIIDGSQQILSHEEQSPAQMIPYMVLINRSIPLSISTIRSLCLAKKILCRLQCFTLRRKKKLLLPRPASVKQPILKVQTDQDYVIFDTLKNLQWKLYKGIAKRKPKTTATWKKSNYDIGKTSVLCPREAEYNLPLIPKNWIIVEYFK